MKSIFNILNIIAFLIFAILIFAIGFRAGQKYDIAIDENNDYVAISYSVNEQKMRRLMSLIDNHYVDHVNTDTLVDKTIKYIMSNLDPHSVYLDQSVSKTMEQKMKGYHIGIGVDYSIYNDSIFVTYINPNSQNAKKIELGDKIIKVNDSTITGKNINKIDSLIKGEPNTFVNLSILRDNQILQVKANRNVILDNSITESYMLNNEIGYIKLKRFGEKSHSEFKQALQKLKNSGMKTLIFDLRGNSGGLLNVAQQIADEFLVKNQLVVFTKDAHGKKQLYYATNNGDFDAQPLYVLIDEESASASEIIAGAIQDNDAGIIVGRRSFGKGLVQREISLGDGTKLRLTTAKYYTPSGRSIQKPYKNGENDEYTKDLTNRYLSGELYSADSIQVPDSLKYKTTKGRIVYGGGGIIPDVFVPLDTIKYSVWYYKYKHKREFDDKILQYIDSNKNKLKKIKEKHFIKFFNPKPLANQLMTDIKNIDIGRKKDEEKYFETYVKSSIAEFIYGYKTAERILNSQDSMLNKIMDLEKQKQ